MAKVTFNRHDPMLIMVRDEKETAELFGADHIDEFGTEIPDETLLRYKKCMSELWEVQKELSELEKKK